MNKPMTNNEMKDWEAKTWDRCQKQAWSEPMNREEIIRMAREAELHCHVKLTEHGLIIEDLQYFANLVATAERKKVAAWMIQRSYATGHGDTTEDLLNELDWQIAERIAAEREACAKVCELMWHEWLDSPEENEPYKPDAEDCYRAIRARGEK